VGFFDRLRRPTIDAQERSVAWVDPSTLTFYGTQVGGLNVGAIRNHPRSGLVLPTLFRAVSMIADASASLPFAAWDPTSQTRVARQPSIVRRPDPFLANQTFVRQTATSLLLEGNAFWFLTAPDADGRPTVARPIPPSEVSVAWNQSKTDVIYEWRGRRMTLGVDIAHLRYIDEPGYAWGLGPVQAASLPIAGAIEAERYAATFFTEAAVPDGVLETPNRLTKDEADRLRDQWTTAHGARRGTAVLSQGMTWKQVSISNRDAEAVASRNLSQQDVARLFGIPSALLNVNASGSSLTYQNQEGIATDFARYAVQPITDRIEAALTDLVPRGQEVRFRFVDLLKADSRTRFDVYQVALANGILTVNEVRDLEGLPPLPGGGDIPETPTREGSTTV